MTCITINRFRTRSQMELPRSKKKKNKAFSCGVYAEFSAATPWRFEWTKFRSRGGRHSHRQQAFQLDVGWRWECSWCQAPQSTTQQLIGPSHLILWFLSWFSVVWFFFIGMDICELPFCCGLAVGFSHSRFAKTFNSVCLMSCGLNTMLLPCGLFVVFSAD